MVCEILTRDDDYEVITVLTSICGGVTGNMNTPSRAFNIGKGGGIGAVGCIGVDCWVSLVIDVEGYASIELITERSTSDSIIAAQGLVSKP
jgi:hypothetical protein